MTRTSTPKFEVYHILTGAVAIADVSKTDAIKFAREMNKGSDQKRIGVRPVRRS